MIKKCIALALAVLMLAHALPAVGESTPLLYRVQDGKGHVLYLLGTIHVGDKATYPLSDAVERAFAEAEILAVEIDLVTAMQDISEMMSYSLAMMYTDPKDDAQKHLSPAVYALGVESLEVPEMQLKRLRPFAWLSLAQEALYAKAELSSELGVDMRLIERAHEAGKQVDSLESMAEQMEMLMAQSDGFVEFQLEEALRYPDESAQSLRDLHSAWKAGNRELLVQLLEEEAEGLPLEWQAEYDAYAKALYHDRDAAFFQDALNYLESGKTVLFAVGAAHIVRPGALADRLAQAGYTVNEIGR